MKPIFIRILLICTALPAIISILLFLPFYHHTVFNCILIGLSVFASYETAHLLGKRRVSVNRSLIPVLGGTIPVITFLTVADVLPHSSIAVSIILLITIVFFREVFHKTEEHFQFVLPRISSSLLIIVYPGIFLAYVVKMTSFSHATFYILYFYAMIVVNDVMAYVFGNLFGKKTTNNNLKVSPNKSLIGFIAGFVSSVLSALIGWYLFKEYLPIPICYIFGIGSLIGAFTIMGDLAESAIKRSAHVKDSGSSIPGRGGLLDSIDSVLFCAPLYYYFIQAVAVQAG